MLCAAGAILVALSGLSTQAMADVTAIPSTPGKPFKHKPSGIVVSPDLAGLPRDNLSEFDDKQLDVIADFRTPDQREDTTLYIFRNVTGDVSVWFDRIQKTMEASSHVGSVTSVIPAAAFTPAGQPNARGLRAVYASTGTAWISSAAALTSIDGWYVAIRASSQTLTPQQLLARVEQSFAGLKWPKEKNPVQAVQPIAACAKQIAQGPDAEPAAVDGSAILLSAVLPMMRVSTKAETGSKPPRWCRDSYSIPNAGVYRPDESIDSYLIAYQDAGRGIWVSADEISGLLSAGSGSDSQKSYSIDLVDIDHDSGFGDFKTLPSFAQAMWTVEHANPASSTSTWGKKNIDINTDATPQQ